MEPMAVEEELARPLLWYVPAVVGQLGSYVTDLALEPRLCVLAAVVADRSIHVFRVAGHSITPSASLVGHSNVITWVEAGGKDAPYVLSSSADGTIRQWSLEPAKEVSRFTDAKLKPILSCCSTTGYVVGGSSDAIFLWKLNGPMKQLRIEDTPDGEVTQVKFHPDKIDRYLVSGDQGGNITVTDVTQLPAEDEGFVASLNTGHSVRRLGFYGRGATRLWCLSDDHHVTLWEIDEALDVEGQGGGGPLAGPTDFRLEMSKACEASGIRGSEITYIVDILHNEATHELYVVGGTVEGGAAVFRLCVPEPGSASFTIGEPWAALPRAGPSSPHGHHGVIRSIVWVPASSTFVTGGEDGKLVHWSPPAPGSAPQVAALQLGGAIPSLPLGSQQRKVPGGKKKERPNPY
eukprot:jgi/Botrbrau1/12977/Bobra.384_1s0003.1